MEKKEVKKLIKSEFKDIFCVNGFTKKSDTLYIKVTESNVLQIINFDLGSIGFTCSVAMQPLYVIEHTQGINLTMGERLSRFKEIRKEWWPYEQLHDGIQEIKVLLLKNGIPWFEEYGTPEGIISFISTNKFKEYGFVAFNPFHQKKNLGFSLLYSGLFDEGVKCINDLKNEIKDNAADFMILYKKKLMEFSTAIINEPDKVSEILNAAVIENKKGLKIKDR